MPEGQIPVERTAAAEPWKLRLVHTITQVATFVMIWWFAGVGSLYAMTFQELSMTQLPVLSEIAVKMSGVMIQPGVLIAAGVAALAVIVVGHFGLIDRALLSLIVVDVVVIVLLLVGWVSLQMPMRQIQEQLSH